ncbi:MAG: sugar-phosphatase [Clostridiales bacterium]|uniref:sugar-phosphatase n=1 Tax=Clostridium sp. N3C TaxID=1776758 RepID=UPI00092E0F5D|nr:sugar-phosphatase [Clostridium sp. N3C]NLZ48935.1 sugar-phosphatase [Clostridiales bacterium]SCN24294.1 Sugar phosphatase YidA [Clostridium sp. N3C]
MYKLIALDMDGTLLRKDKTISERTFNALQAARERGVKVVLSTGRPVMGIRNYLDYLGLNEDDEYAITFNGSAVQTGKSGNMLFQKFMTGKDLHRIYKLSQEHDLNIHAFDKNGRLITPKANKYTDVEAEINKIQVQVEDFNNIKYDDKIIKVMIVDEPEKLDKLEKNMPKEYSADYSIMRSASIFLEFLKPGINKSIGLSVLSEHLNIAKEEIIAVGDADNDIAMIKYAGLGVAMDNAFPQVKEAADYITSSNNDDGVAEVIEKFILGK